MSLLCSESPASLPILTVHVHLCNCTDAVLDRAITPSTAQYIVWATGPRGTVDGFAYFHTSWPSNLQTTLQFGRRATNNCGALSCSMPPTCPFTQETFCVTNMDATFVAKIGQSGGPRGHEGLMHGYGGLTVGCTKDLVVRLLL